MAGGLTQHFGHSVLLFRGVLRGGFGFGHGAVFGASPLFLTLALNLLQRLVTLKNTYQTNPDYEDWMKGALNKAIYSTLRDSIEANVGEEAKELLNREQHVN